MWAGLSPFGGPTETGLSDMIVRQSGRDRFAHEPGCDHAEPRTRFDVLVKTGEAFKMKDTIDRRATLGALTNVPGGFPLSQWRRPSIRSLRRSSAIA